MLEAGQRILDFPNIAVRQRALHDGSTRALTKPLQKQLQTDRERRMTGRRKEDFFAPSLLNLLSPTPMPGSPLAATVASTAVENCYKCGSQFACG